MKTEKQTESTCPNEANHTPHPVHYTAHMDWMEEMSKTHDQKQCPDCGRWEIWIKKPQSVGTLNREGGV